MSTLKTIEMILALRLLRCARFLVDLLNLASRVFAVATKLYHALPRPTIVCNSGRANPGGH
jgi:hypothetical protein